MNNPGRTALVIAASLLTACGEPIAKSGSESPNTPANKESGILMAQAKVLETRAAELELELKMSRDACALADYNFKNAGKEAEAWKARAGKCAGELEAATTVVQKLERELKTSRDACALAGALADTNLRYFRKEAEEWKARAREFELELKRSHEATTVTQSPLDAAPTSAANQNLKPAGERIIQVRRLHDSMTLSIRIADYSWKVAYLKSVKIRGQTVNVMSYEPTPEGRLFSPPRYGVLLTDPLYLSLPVYLRGSPEYLGVSGVEIMDQQSEAWVTEYVTGKRVTVPVPD